MSILFISPCFYPDANPARFLLSSAKNHNLPIMLYGVGEPFGPSAHGADSQAVRPLEILKKRTEDYVMAVDCRDVIFLADEKEIMDKFLKFGSKMVVSTERGCHPPNPEVQDNLPKSRNGFDYVNIGAWMAEREYAIYVLQFLLDNIRGTLGPGAIALDNPQAWLPVAMVRKHLTDISLDRNCEMFLSMSSWNLEMVEVKEGRVYSKATDTWPVLIHFNGSGSDNCEPTETMYERIYGRP